MRGWNPVFLLEVRQLVRSRYTLLNSCLLLVALISYSGWLVYDMSNLGMEFMAQGQKLQSGIIAILSVNCLLLVPIVCSSRLTRSMHFQFQMTTLTPWMVMRGKIWSALVMIALSFCLSLPFLVLAIQLRGTDIVQIMQMFLVLAAGGALSVQFFLLLRVLIISRSCGGCLFSFIVIFLSSLALPFVGVVIIPAGILLGVTGSSVVSILCVYIVIHAVTAVIYDPGHFGMTFYPATKTGF